MGDSCRINDCTIWLVYYIYRYILRMHIVFDVWDYTLFCSLHIYTIIVDIYIKPSDRCMGLDISMCKYIYIHLLVDTNCFMKGGLDVTIGVDGKIPGCLAGGILRCSQANLRVHLRAIPVLEFLGEITAVSLLILFCCCCSAHFYLSNPHSPASNFRWNPPFLAACAMSLCNRSLTGCKVESIHWPNTFIKGPGGVFCGVLSSRNDTFGFNLSRYS